MIQNQRLSGPDLSLSILDLIVRIVVVIFVVSLPHCQSKPRTSTDVCEHTVGSLAASSVKSMRRPRVLPDSMMLEGSISARSSSSLSSSSSVVKVSALTSREIGFVAAQSLLTLDLSFKSVCISEGRVADDRRYIPLSPLRCQSPRRRPPVHQSARRDARAACPCPHCRTRSQHPEPK